MLGQTMDWALWWAYGVLGVVLVIASYTDVRYGTIYNWLTYPAVLIGLAGHTVLGGLAGLDAFRLGLAGSAAGLAAGFLPLMLVWLAGGIGGGDAKLMGVVGALTGWRFALAAMLYGFLVAAAMAILVMLVKRVTRRTLRRIWVSVVLAFGAGQRVDPARPDSPKIPFGLALCIGSGLALAEAIIQGPMAGKVMGW